MKRFIGIFLISLYLTFNVTRLKPALAISGNLFSQGIYKSSDLNISKSDIFTIQNVSTEKRMYLYILDENQVIVESIRLLPNIQKFDTVPLKPNYVILIVGEGQVYLTSKKS